MKYLSLAATCLALVATGHAQASTVTATGGHSFQSGLGSAEAYRDAVEAAISSSPLGTNDVALFDGLTSRNLFKLGTSTVDTAFKYTIDFGVSAAQTGNWSFRFGVDFGGGGAVFLDGKPVSFNNTDMWWSGSYTDTGESFQFSAEFLSAGNHTLTVYGFEHCCDGAQQGQFKSANASGFTTFGQNDGLVAVVPEPENLALMLAGLAALGLVSRRRRRA